jgi:hypothetical protein
MKDVQLVNILNMSAFLNMVIARVMNKLANKSSKAFTFHSITLNCILEALDLSWGDPTMLTTENNM